MLATYDPARALAVTQAITARFDPERKQCLESLVASSPAPGQLLHYLGEMHRRRPELLDSLPAAGLRHAAAVFSYSRFLSEACLEHPVWLESVENLYGVRSGGDYRMLLAGLLESEAAQPVELMLARFRRQQLLRILLRDVLGYGTLSEIAEELSGLADAIVEAGYRQVREDLVSRHGAPRECGMAVIALGKLGGRELNYSSDIDLMFVYGGNGETDGEQPVSYKEFYKKAANRLTAVLSTYTTEGQCYRVDLRLRPDGTLGEAAISLDGARRYYRTRARDWELQMMIKARVSAGDAEVGAALLDAVEPLIYSTTLDFSAVEAVSATRERIDEKVAARRARGSGFDVKLAPGGIRDIEFLVQCLQRLHGGRITWLRHGGTLLALARLRDKDLLSASEYGRLASAYQFLRHLEHRLQFADDRQTHALPSQRGELELVARRMPVPAGGEGASAAHMLSELNTHLESVQEIYERVIHAQQPTYYSLGREAAPEIAASGASEPAKPGASNLVRFLDELAPRLAAAVKRNPPVRGAGAFEHLLEKLIQSPDLLGFLERDTAASGHLLDIFEHSRYFAEQLARTPELLLEIAGLAGEPAAPYRDIFTDLDGAAELRRYYRREMFRIQAASICLNAPIFATLEHTSDLADAAIRAAYRMALQSVLASHPPVSPSYAPDKQMMAIALGRLGMREFDLSSDADLIFVLPDPDADEHVFWTRAANRMIEILTAYTGDGVLFAVDTRLRPNGGAGPLVQSESACKDYFARSAEAWEGISYMKARVVAGETEGEWPFLKQLQDLDWRRYGQSGRSRKDLRLMRLRLEKEQGHTNPLKAGEGGYYDIDFLLLYLRLKGAGIFFKVLNTPARIDVVEQMGHLERAEAAFLRDAAVFYRGLDHGLRIGAGHAEGNLPASGTQREALTALVSRWIPEHRRHLPLEEQLTRIRRRTREIFNLYFA